MDLEFDFYLLSELLLQLSDREFKTLKDEQVSKLLLSESDKVRKIAALRGVKCLSKARLKEMLANYMQVDEKRYYNVIHWLDFGVSAPRDVAAKAVAKVLARDRD
jgi:hypothetical protein